MNKIRLLRSRAIQQLHKSIFENLHLYRDGSFDYIEADPSNFFEIDHLCDLQKLSDLECGDGDKEEVTCCIHLYEAMGKIPPYLARDERLWVYLTHTALLDYSKKRWPIPLDDAKAVTHIRKHFFAPGNRGIERDNAASRLWWMAELCARVEGLDLHDALTSLLHQSDVRANIIERPTTSQSIPVLSAMLKKLDDSYRNDKSMFERDKFRSIMKQLNLRGGVKLLGALTSEEISLIVDDCAK